MPPDGAPEDGSRRLSVVVRCHNQAPYLDEALRSVATQARRPDEVLVVDDGSTDGSAGVAERHREGWPELRVVRRAVARGGPQTFNDGVAATSAPYVVVLDADDRLGPGYLEAVMETQRSSGADIVTTDIQLFGTDDRFIPTRPITRWRMALECPAHSSSLFRRWVFDATGGRPVGLLPGDNGEDWAMWLAAAEMGARFAVAPHAVLEYRRQASSMSAVDHRGATTTHLWMHRLHPDMVGYRHVALRAGLGVWRSTLRAVGLRRLLH